MDCPQWLHDTDQVAQPHAFGLSMEEHDLWQ